MSNHEFTLVIDHPLSDAELGAVYEASGADTATLLSDDHTFVRFERDAPALAEALTSALADITRAGLQVIAVHTPDNLDSLDETLDLLRTPGAAEAIAEGAAEIAAGRFVDGEEIKARYGVGDVRRGWHE